MFYMYVFFMYVQYVCMYVCTAVNIPRSDHQEIRRISSLEIGAGFRPQNGSERVNLFQLQSMFLCILSSPLIAYENWHYLRLIN